MVSSRLRGSVDGPCRARGLLLLPLLLLLTLGDVGAYFDVFFTRGTTLSLVRVDEDGAVRDLAPSVVATSVSGSVRAPAVATDRAGKVLVAYETFDSTPGVRAMRVASEIIDWNGTGSGAPPAGTVCGALASAPCETDQVCDGSSAACQPKGPAPSSVICRPSAGAGSCVSIPNSLACASAP